MAFGSIDKTPLDAEFPLVAASHTNHAFDVVATLATALFLLPVLIKNSLFIFLDSRGLLMFRQRRIVLNAETILALKFRLMTVMEDSAEVRHATRNDQRVTRDGKIIRRSIIDEFPQLSNPLKGQCL